MQGGDSLQSIAETLWGDSSFWYLIADANGLSGAESLTGGMSLIIPNKVHNIHNNADTFRPYDPNTAEGALFPGMAKPAKHGANCGIFGQILLVVVAAVVAYFTAGAALTALGVEGGLAGATLGEAVVAGAIGGAAGSVASQAVGLATGMQSSFNWGAVGMAAIGGGVGAGLGNIGAFSSWGEVGGAIARGVTGNVITQGVGVATGLQKSFDWAGVAAAGVMAGVSAFASEHLPGAAHPDLAASVKAGQLVMAPASFSNQLLSGMAGMLAGAATRSLVNGSDFGDNIVAMLPDVIGQTIGNSLAQSMDTDSTPARVQPEEQKEFDNYLKSVDDHGLLLEIFGSAGSDAAKKIATGDGYRDAILKEIGTVEDDLKKLQVNDPKLAAKYQRIFNISRLNLDSYSATQQAGLTAPGYNRIDQGYLDKAGINFDLSRLDTADGYFAAIYTDPEAKGGGFIFTNRGTEGFMQETPAAKLDTVADIWQQLGYKTPQYVQAIAAAQDFVAAAKGASVLFTGHSLGGGLAIAQAIATNHHAIVFNTAAVRIETLLNSHVQITKSEFDKYYNNPGLITAYGTEWDPLSFGTDHAARFLASYSLATDNGKPGTGLDQDAAKYFGKMGQYLPPEEAKKTAREVMRDILDGPKTPRLAEPAFWPRMYGNVADNHNIYPAVFNGIDNTVRSWVSYYNPAPPSPEAPKGWGE